MINFLAMCAEFVFKKAIGVENAHSKLLLLVVVLM
jgi:hypothetical protein